MRFWVLFGLPGLNPTVGYKELTRSQVGKRGGDGIEKDLKLRLTDALNRHTKPSPVLHEGTAT